MGRHPLGTLAELGKLVNGEVRGPGEHFVRRLVPVGSDDPEGIAFAESEEYLRTALGTGVGALIVPRGAPEFDRPALLVESPRLAFFQLLTVSNLDTHVNEGVHETAIVGEGANLGSQVRIGPYAVLDGSVEIGEGTEVFPFVFVGPRCRIGKNCRILPGSVLLQDVELGDGVIVHSGAVLGSDGFGFQFDGKRQVKIPQVGAVEIGDAVEIGANTTIDRATCGETVVREGSKIDNLVQVGHNSRIGAHTVLAGQVGVSGSVVIGDRAVIGGQTALADHVSLADDVSLAGRTGVMADIVEPGAYFGTPALPMSQALRILALQTELPQLVKRIRALEKEVERLKGGS